MRRVQLALAALAVLAASVSSCLSPTLPLPPPDVPDAIDVDTNGLWQISGHCDPGSLVTVFNAKTARGVVVQDVNESGFYHVELTGQPCDLAWVQEQTLDGDVSPQTRFVLEAFSQGEPVDPNTCP